MITPRTLKGFRDFLPNEARKRQYVIDKLKAVFESFGFEPLETPTLEYEEILGGKYGDEGEKLMYRFEDQGKRQVAMRYDQTVPLARVVAQHGSQLPMPFKRYQIQPVWRAENTQKGRYREFVQCDIDTVGSTSVLADAEILAVAAKVYEILGFSQTRLQILINDRVNFAGIPKKAITIMDKFDKIGALGVVNELKNAGFEPSIWYDLFDKKEMPASLRNILSYFTQFMGLEDYQMYPIGYKPTLARGLDYYTSTIFEVKFENYTAGSIGGGGRYDNLMSLFTNKQIPAVGFAFGFDRIIEAMEDNELFPKELSQINVLITIFSSSPSLIHNSIQAAIYLRENGINTELYLDENAKLDKQLKYANQKGIPYVIVIGPDEAEKNVVNLKNMKTKEQKKVTIEEVIETIKK